MSEKNWKYKIKKFFKKAKKKIMPRFVLQEGAKRVYTNIIDFRDTGPHKFHLRILKNATGILIIDAKFVLYLNHTAMVYFKHFINGRRLEEIQDYFVRHYRTTKEEVAEDYNGLLDKVYALLTTEDACPFTEIGFSPRRPFKVSEFPLRVDLAITYQCNNDCLHCYVPPVRKNLKELDLGSIKKILDILWDVGVPHIALTGGEPTLRDDFLDIIEYGQQKGFIMGIITNGRKFSDPQLVKKAIEKGLDYAQITLESHDKEIHNKMVGADAFDETVQAIKNFEKEDIFFMTNTTLCNYNADSIIETIKFLDELNVKTFACNGIIYSGKGAEYEDAIPESDLEPILEDINHEAINRDMKFIWYTPTQYCSLNPIELGLGHKKCSAANISIAIEPNGAVLPCQSYFHPVGNLLKDDWEDIWYSELFEKIRNYEYIESKCKKCELLQLCGGGCPLYIERKKLTCHIVNF
ncbi:MAG: radical SAM/SPASM domain-containing protein [Promethearchaeota archaeon]